MVATQFMHFLKHECLCVRKALRGHDSSRAEGRVSGGCLQLNPPLSLSLSFSLSLSLSLCLSLSLSLCHSLSLSLALSLSPSLPVSRTFSVSVSVYPTMCSCMPGCRINSTRQHRSHCILDTRRPIHVRRFRKLVCRSTSHQEIYSTTTAASVQHLDWTQKILCFLPSRPACCRTRRPQSWTPRLR